MAKYPSENTDTLKYFRAFLNSWVSKMGMNKTLAAKRLGLAQSQLNEILNAKRGASINVIEKICASIRVNIIDALDQGRRLCGEEPTQEKLNPAQAEALKAFEDCLMAGGEAADMLARNAIELARRKKASEIPPPSATVISKSA